MARAVSTAAAVTAVAVAFVLVGCSGDDDTAPTTVPTTVVPTTAAPTTVPEVVQPAPARLDAPLDATAFATGLSEAELIIRDPASTAVQVSAAGARLQLLIRSLSDHSDLDEQVIAALDPQVRPTIERVIRARQFLQAKNAEDPTPSTPSPTLPAWTVVEPDAPDALLALYHEAEAMTGVPWYYLAAIHLQETRMGRIIGTSSAGAVGPMQFLPETWASCCTGDPLNTRDAIIGAATYLVHGGAPLDMAAALHQYNPSDTYVAVVTAYAENMRDVPALYGGYHGFQVFYSSAAGTVRLPVGYSQTQPIDAAVYLASHPDDAA
ncbi:MAG: lytic transglycosylase domain-containing protein [Ilumatobacteraceae bacterium]